MPMKLRKLSVRSEARLAAAAATTVTPQQRAGPAHSSPSRSVFARRFGLCAGSFMLIVGALFGLFYYAFVPREASYFHLLTVGKERDRLLDDIQRRMV